MNFDEAGEARTGDVLMQIGIIERPVVISGRAGNVFSNLYGRSEFIWGLEF